MAIEDFSTWVYVNEHLALGCFRLFSHVHNVPDVKSALYCYATAQHNIQYHNRRHGCETDFIWRNESFKFEERRHWPLETNEQHRRNIYTLIVSRFAWLAVAHSAPYENIVCCWYWLKKSVWRLYFRSDVKHQLTKISANRFNSRYPMLLNGVKRLSTVVEKFQCQ